MLWLLGWNLRHCECKVIFDRLHSKPMRVLSADSVYPPHTQITLRTRLDNEIDNIQSWQHSGAEWQRLYQEPNRWESSGAVRLGEACPVYNCHGLTFASRRTQLYDSTTIVISKVLEDDGYTQVTERSTRVGDVVVYYDEKGEAQHSGIVVSKLEASVIMVWSKWGKGFEVVHPAGNCLWGSLSKKFYRITKWKYEDFFKVNS